MDQISNHINSSNHRIHIYDIMIKKYCYLVSKKGKDNYNYSFQLTSLHNSLLMSVFNFIEKDLSNADGKSDVRKLYKSLAKSSSSLFSCSVHTIYNIVNRAQKQCVMLK